MKQANIKVAVRIRPMLEDEAQQGHTSTKLEIDQERKIINVYHDRINVYKNSQFDYVLDQNSSQRKVYDQVEITEMVKKVVDGYHATIFAYGQTGSGKTFTMEGYKYRPNEKGVPVPVIEQSESEGIVPRAIHQLFDFIKQQNSLQKKKFTVYCSYLQIYKEKIFDLLNKAQLKRLVNDGPGLKLKWNKHDHFSVENLYTFECRTPDDVMALYHFGIKNKVVASHNMNNASSRSHTMLSLTIEQIDVKSPDNVITSKLQLVDLAGSERQALTGTQANKESIDINKSLFTLRQVITALTDKKNQNQTNAYVPYRDSKLTSLLRQSLGGNSFCLMIACLNPCDAYVDENISTLQYASRASFISNKPVKNDDPRMRLIEDLKKENKLLTEELTKANETIQFLSQLTGKNPQTVQANLKNVRLPGLQSPSEPKNVPSRVFYNQEGTPGQQYNGDQTPQRQGSASSAVTEKRGNDSERRNIITERVIKDKDNIEQFFKEKSETLQNIANINKPISQTLPSAVNESKDAITERIIHTVNMMKEVLQSNLSLRETIQKQSEIIDSCNVEIFQLQNENEDLRDRLQILEDYTGKDTHSDLTRLVKEKKVLENRVKHLEQTSMNWAQFQATRTQFHQSKDKIVNQSQAGLQPKATLEHQFNDDYEPVRAVINSDQSDSSSIALSDQFKNENISKKNQKLQQLNLQKQLINRGKSTQPMSIFQSSVGIESVNAGNDRHQEYKIRTVKSLAQAYHQQQQMQNQINQQIRNRNMTTKATHQGSASNKFINQTSVLNLTQYEKQRNSIGFSNNGQIGKFNGNNTQELSYQDNMGDREPQQSENTRNTRSTFTGQNSGKFVTSNHSNNNMRQQSEHPPVDRYANNSSALGGNPESFPKDLFSRDKQHINAQPGIQLPQQMNLRRREAQDQQSSSGSKPPKSPNKYSSSWKKSANRTNGNVSGGGGGNSTVTQNSYRDKLNVSADYIYNSQSSQLKGDTYNESSQIYDNDSSENQDEFYENEENIESDLNQNNQTSDAYEALRIYNIKKLQQQQQQQQLSQQQQYQIQQRSESGFGQVDVSLPMIRSSGNQ